MKKNPSFVTKLFLTIGLLMLAGCSSLPASSVQEDPLQGETSLQQTQNDLSSFSLDDIAAYEGTPYTTVNENIPFFSEEEKQDTTTFETYNNLDELGRCQSAYANLQVSLMPTEDRESIGMIKPSGWKTSKYDFVDGKYLFNRCHLIGFQLAGENANEKNLITGTRYMNTEGMLPFENMVADYLKETNNHVLYRVTPIFSGDELVARGVLMEAYSVEDQGKGIEFNVFCYNVQPGVTINYANGENYASADDSASQSTQDSTQQDLIINENSRKFHLANCVNADRIAPKNRREVHSSIQALIDEGYEAAQCCIH